MKAKTKVKTDLKITIEQLKNYLGTELQMKVRHNTISNTPVINPLFSFDCINTSKGWLVWTYDEKFLDQFGFCGKGFKAHELQPICYRLSDLDKFIPELGFVPFEEIDSHHNFSVLKKGDLMTDPLRYPFTVNQALFHWHFWTFGDEYFEKGLVIDKISLAK